MVRNFWIYFQFFQKSNPETSSTAALEPQNILNTLYVRHPARHQLFSIDPSRANWKCCVIKRIFSNLIANYP